MSNGKKFDLDELVNLTPAEINERLHRDIPKADDRDGLRKVTREELREISRKFDEYLKNLKKEITGI